jgi:DNA adenine methylase
VQYQGGKARLAKYFAPFIERGLEHSGGFLYEPFTGGFNIQPALRPGLVKRALNGDAHKGLITMYRALQAGWEPPEELSEPEWRALKEERDWSKPITAFAAFGCSFRAYEFGGYAHDPEGRGFAGRARAGLLRKRAFMGPVEFRWQDFEDGTLDCDLVERATIYVDPPYANTAGYLSGTGFDHGRFYRWCGRMADAGHVVLMSEFTPPQGVEYDVLWEKPRTVAGRADPTKAVAVEQVYYIRRSK